MPVFSIIVPIYNVEEYLRECLDSLRAQTFGDFEVLCVIDGSPDNSIDIARDYEASDARFHVLEKPNGGLSSARNFGIEHAVGDYLAFVDADDRVTPDFCATLAAAFAGCRADAVVFGASVFPEEANTEWFDEVLSPQDVSYASFDTVFMFAPYTTPFAWRCAVRREALARSGVVFDEEIPFGEDVVFQFALYPRIGALAAISSKLYEYRQNRAGSLMDEWGTDALRLSVHRDMVGRIFADWERIGLAEKHGAELFEWSIDNLLYGVDRLTSVQRREQFAAADKLWSRYFDAGVHPVQVEKGCLCRGEGKLYWECSVRSVMPFERLHVSALVNGSPVPVGAYPLTEEESGCEQRWVLELPWMAADAIQLELSPDGRAYERAVIPCSYTTAKWQSRLNYRLQGDECAKIRDFERDFAKERYLVEARERFPHGDHAIWRVAIEWEGDSGSLPAIAVQDAQGAPMSCPVHVMEHQANELPNGLLSCRVVLSVKLPAGCNHFLVSAEGGGRGGFTVVDPEAAHAAERIAFNFMKHAGEDDEAYRRWLDDNRATPSALWEQADCTWTQPVRFGCLVVQRPADAGAVDATLDSLRAQSYVHWDAAVADEPTTVETAAAIAETAARLDCDYLVILAAGDVVEPDALHEYAQAIRCAGDAGSAPDVLYCDEDLVEPHGECGSPLFKSTFNPDLLYCGNWVGNLLAVRAELALRVLPGDPQAIDAWMYDLVLRAYEEHARFSYVARMLHHAVEQPFPGKSGSLCDILQEHLNRRGISAAVELRADRAGLRVRYAIPAPHPLVSIIVPSKDQCELLESCVGSIERMATYDNYEVVVVENNSEQEDTIARYRALEETYDNVRVVRWAGSFNYSSIVNYGAAHARGDYLLFLNNDTRVVEPSFIEEMLGFLQRPEVGVVGAKLLFEDGLVQHAGMVVGVWDAVAHVNQNRAVDQGGYLDRACLPGEYSAVTGACQLVSRDTFEAVGGYDERFVVGFNDVDFCLRVQQAGKLVVLAPDAVLHHLEFASRGREVEGERLVRWRRERAAFARRWPEPFVKGDPYTSPNLKRDNTYYWLDDDTSKRDELRGPVQLARRALDFPRDQLRSARRAVDERRDKTGNGASYNRWFMRHHRATRKELDRQRATRFERGPLFSLIVPLYETPVDYFQEMADSVLAQTYGKWELVLVNASPDKADLCSAVEKLAESDKRVVVRELSCNLGITINTNEGIEASSGDFLCFFDHDDTLEPNALFEYACAICEKPEVDMLYCDEDKLLDGRYIGGFFKPDYDETLIRSANYVTHFLAVRASIVHSFGELPGPEFDGAQDHNMTMRAAEQARAICHIPKVLYHWRIHEGSTADDEGAKLWACESGRLAVTQHLERMGVKARVEHDDEFAFVFKAAYLPQVPSDEITVVITACDAAQLASCLESFVDSGATAREVLVAWHGDAEEAKRLGAGPGWACGASCVEALNKAMEIARGSLVAVVASAVVPVSADWLDGLVMHAARENVWACGPKLLNQDDTVRSVGVIMSKGVPVRFDAGADRRQRDMHLLTRFPREISALDPDCFVIRRGEFLQSGGLDESLSYYGAALKLFLQLEERGGTVVVDPRVEMRVQPAGEDGLEGDAFVECDEIKTLSATYPVQFEGPDPHYNVNYAAGSARFELE